MSDPYAWWMSALELAGDCGKLDRVQASTLGVTANDPHDGFYLAGNNDFVAIWHDGQRASWNGITVDPVDVWVDACRYPIEEERFRMAERRGFVPQLSVFVK